MRLSSGTDRTALATSLERMPISIFDRVGLTEMEPRRFGPDGCAELHDDTKLVWVDAEGEGVEGYDGRDRHADQEQKRAREASTAWHHLLELVLAAPNGAPHTGSREGANGTR